ncbi:aromatic-ring-hydroxylating dioxygenase subunit beta, partial [Streptomyces sp. NPDC056728]
MTTTTVPGESASTQADDVRLLESVRQFLYREARYLDDREFERWLECYHPDAEFWMPAWADDDELTRDPQTEI